MAGPAGSADDGGSTTITGPASDELEPLAASADGPSSEVPDTFDRASSMDEPSSMEEPSSIGETSSISGEPADQPIVAEPVDDRDAGASELSLDEVEGSTRSRSSDEPTSGGAA
jgi:hypothetical protein